MSASAAGGVISASYTNNPRPKVYKAKPIFTCPHHGVHCPNTTWTPPEKPWRVLYPYLNHLDNRPKFDTWAQAYAFACTLKPPRMMNYYRSLAAH